MGLSRIRKLTPSPVRLPRSPPQTKHPRLCVPDKGLHVGAKYETDITGSCEAGMEAVCVKRSQSLFEDPDVSTTREAGRRGEAGRGLMGMGL